MHFITCHKIDDASHITNLFFIEIVCLHDIYRSIASDYDVKFLGYFWRTLWRKLETKLFFFLQLVILKLMEKNEIVNRNLSQLLHVIIQKNLKSWEECLPFIEFAYNRIVYSTIDFSSFEIVMGLIH
jgi:hypothetical protein